MPLAGQSIALGSIVEADFDGDDPGATPTYVAVGLVKGYTSTDRPGTEADGKVLSDTLDVPLPGIEGPSIFTFDQYWHPGEAEQEKFDSAFDNRFKPAGVSGGVVTIRVLYPNNGVEVGDAMPTEAFTTNVLNIGKPSYDEPNAVIMRTIQLRRTSAITKGTFTVV